ncbi:kinesin-domain-containing protein [Dacryopinax primogenitus]|uniref:Kinesin-domain-containing protein n=1 Tax=Dacryopinax primogenitus (strain DJM 731) TaxID=1858805 RepID=M5FQM9_DACPD|nr:kinesin-domain-containing protein [Dacryopinax primogenitus]EJT97848.1 kinesin-domain-containing protein [Dacryopinax primogenitus]
MSRRLPAPALPRARAPTVPSSSSSRPRLPLAKSTASLRSADQAQSRGSTPLPPVSHVQAMESLMSPQKREGGDNIQVAVRCRGRNQKEIDEQSPIIIGCPMLHSSPPDPHEITIETGHSAGSVPLPGSLISQSSNTNTRTYPFDRVFGPEVDQATIYQSVVEPLLREVLEGYNCSLLAYGQTGTGKTYTMQGDLSPSPLTGGPSTNSGMIPRALSALFTILGETATDWSVKCSYIELYNEELRDLLAQELPAPAGNAQPMSRGKELPPGLKLFEDGAKKGCVIQGLEEVAIKDERDAMRLLLRGSKQRQVAATKFNDHSSRSHSVFTITVHSTSPAPPKLGVSSQSENEFLRVGKLNLVDLAGSENIGRSGAADKRAREAGMINQSLLTLGRVINALVEGSAHVPYRESKLTRLLQDSLGGRTKTTLIATVSPAKSNLEETLSTLEYALTAKAIKNRPEINQRMSKSQLIKEYNVELERLKADLLAARKMEGVWVSNETWEELTRDTETRRTAHVEATRRVLELEVQMKALQTEFNESLALLSKRDGELKDARAQMAKDEAELREKEAELGALLLQLQEEVALRSAYQSSETRLQGIASELTSVLRSGLEDVDCLFGKVDRKQRAIVHNRKTVSKHAARVEEVLVGAEGDVAAFVVKQDEALGLVRGLLGGLKERQAQALEEQRLFLDSRLDALAQYMSTIRTQEEHTNDAASCMQASVALEGEQARQDVNRVLLTLRDEVRAKNAQTAGLLEGGLEEVRGMLERVCEALLGVGRETRAFAQEERVCIDLAVQEQLRLAAAREERLQQQVEALRTLLVQQQDTHHKELEAQLAQYRQKSSQGLAAALAHFGKETAASISQDKEETGVFTQLLEERVDRARAHQTSAEGWEREANSLREEALLVVDSVSSTAGTALAHVSAEMSTLVESQHLTVQHRFAALNEAFLLAHRRVEESKRERIRATDALEDTVRESYTGMKRKREEAWVVEEREYEAIDGQTSALHTLAAEYHTTLASHITAVRKHNKAMVEHGTAEDKPTGETPERKRWRYPQEWELTGEREEVLEDWRRRAAAAAADQAGDGEEGEDTPDSAQEVEDTCPDPVQKSLTVLPLHPPMTELLEDVVHIPTAAATATAGARTKGIPRASARLPAPGGRENIPLPGHGRRPSKRARQ